MPPSFLAFPFFGLPTLLSFCVYAPYIYISILDPLSFVVCIIHPLTIFIFDFSTPPSTMRLLYIYIGRVVFLRHPLLSSGRVHFSCA